MAPRRLQAVNGHEPPKNTKEALARKSQELLDCRDLRHPWSSLGTFYAQGKHGREVHRKLVCQRCGTEATDIWSPRGHRYARVYKYVEGYIDKGISIKPVQVRQEVLSRIEVYADEETMLAALFSPRRRARA